jgi:phosphoglycolate phosphatase
MNKLLIFDFDGTIADSFLMAIEEYNRAAPFVLAKRLDMNEVEEARDLSIHEFLTQRRLNIISIFILLIVIRHRMRGRVSELQPFVNIFAQIRGIRLQHPDLDVGIVSSNSVKIIEDFLREHSSQDCFDFVHTATGIYGKAGVIKKIAQKYEISTKNILYVGDEPRDIDTSNRCGAQSVAVTWGFGSEKSLVHHLPDFLIRKTNELSGVVEVFVQKDI